MQKSLTLQQVEMLFSTLDRTRYQEKNKEFLPEDPVCSVCKDMGGWESANGKWIVCTYCPEVKE